MRRTRLKSSGAKTPTTEKAIAAPRQPRPRRSELTIQTQPSRKALWPIATTTKPAEKSMTAATSRKVGVLMVLKGNKKGVLSPSPPFSSTNDGELRLIAGAASARISRSCSLTGRLDRVDVFLLTAGFRIGISARNTSKGVRVFAGRTLFARRQSHHEGCSCENENELFHFRNGRLV